MTPHNNQKNNSIEDLETKISTLKEDIIKEEKLPPNYLVKKNISGKKVKRIKPISEVIEACTALYREKIYPILRSNENKEIPEEKVDEYNKYLKTLYETRKIVNGLKNGILDNQKIEKFFKVGKTEPAPYIIKNNLLIQGFENFTHKRSYLTWKNRQKQKNTNYY